MSETMVQAGKNEHVVAQTAGHAVHVLPYLKRRDGGEETKRRRGVGRMQQEGAVKGTGTDLIECDTLMHRAREWSS